MELSVFDLSKHLGVTASTIERWLRQGTLPVSRKGANIKFQVKELEIWAAKHNLTLDLSDKPESAPKINPDQICLSSAILNGGIYTDIEGTDSQAVLEQSVCRLKNLADKHKPDILARLIDRENALSTGIGNGIALPHPREQVPYIDTPMVGVCFLKSPVDYKALDSNPVSVLFILLCPELKMHLQLLSSLSFCLKNPDFITLLKSRPADPILVERVDEMLSNNSLL